ncbi:MAG: hypothetical protein ACRD2O_16935 [Terriglobia bacterium]
MNAVHFGRRRHIGVAFWMGVVLLSSGAGLYAKSIADEHARNWKPLVLPVSLTQGTIKTPELGANLDGDYDIIIEFDRKVALDRTDWKITLHRMDCLLGVLTPNGVRPDWCKGIPNLSDISWILFEGKDVISDGNSGYYPGGVWSAKVERHIGRFTAQKGHRYTLVLNVKRDASQLNADNPTLVIMVPQEESEGYGALRELQKLGALILALAGGTLVLVGFVHLWGTVRER